MILKKVLILITVLFSSNLFSQFSEEQVYSAVNDQKEKFQLSEGDIENLLITDNYISLEIKHAYFKQAIEGLEIYDSYGAIHSKGIQSIFEGSRLYQGLMKYEVIDASPINIASTIEKIAAQKSYDYTNDLVVSKAESGLNQKAEYLSNSISNSPIQTRLVFYNAGNSQFRMGRIITIDEKKSADYFEFLVDASTGDIVKEHNYTLYCEFEDGKEQCAKTHDHSHKSTVKLLGESPSKKIANTAPSILAPNQYRVYAYPVESPLYGPQTDVTEPWLLNTTASPNGWHNYNSTNFTHSRGNNVDAYMDDDDTEGPTGGNAARASGGANLEFLYTIDTMGNPVNFQDGAVVNLFYWNNTIHDMWFNYGFDEASGNFQEENYTASGSGSDFVNAEAQDGQGTCNANMSTPSDGGNPRMQMYLCNGRDGDLDNGVVIHEYAHGISNRLTGGPGAAGCLGNQEQMGEGWSDYYGLIMTIVAADTSETLRPIGNWLLGEGTSGDGIRTYPYTTNMTVNPFTYDDIKTQSVPHGVGSVWATMLWDMTWAFIDAYGFDSDMYNGTGGNNMAMLLVTEGMKIQPCSPGFTDGRDAILAADNLHYGGANKCLIWEAFANRGLGFSANQASSGSRSDGTEGFDMPPSCSVELTKTADRTDVDPGDNIVYTFTATNQTTTARNNMILSDVLPEGTNFVTASDNGQLVGESAVYPSYNLAGNSSKTWTLTVEVDPNIDPIVPDFVDDIESGASAWDVANNGSTSFNISSAQANSGTMSWFANDGSSPGVSSITTTDLLFPTSNSVLTFTHWYDTEATWDGGKVFISTDDGTTWQDLDTHFTSNGYNSRIYNSTSNPAFSGNSGGFITSTVNLAAFANLACKVKFEMYCDQSVGGLGWYIDDVSVDNQQLLIPNTAILANATETFTGVLAAPTAVNETAFSCNFNEVAIEITFDEDPGEISFIVRNNLNEILLQKGPFINALAGSTITELVCLEDVCNTIEFIDSGNNGLCNGGLVGSYTIKNNISGQVYLQGCDIGSGITEDLCFPLLSNIADKTEPSCTGATDATIDLTVVNGNPNVSYLYNNGATSEDLSNLAAGTYSVIINDGVTTLYDTIIIYASIASVYKTEGVDGGTLRFAAANACPTYTIRFEDVLMNNIVIVNQEVTLTNRYVKGLGANMVTVSGNNVTRIFNIPSLSQVTIHGLTLANATSPTDGGALINNGKLNLKDIIFINNTEGALSKSFTNNTLLTIQESVKLQE